MVDQHPVRPLLGTWSSLTSHILHAHPVHDTVSFFGLDLPLFILHEPHELVERRVGINRRSHISRSNLALWPVSLALRTHDLSREPTDLICVLVSLRIPRPSHPTSFWRMLALASIRLTRHFPLFILHLMQFILVIVHLDFFAIVFSLGTRLVRGRHIFLFVVQLPKIGLTASISPAGGA